MITLLSNITYFTETPIGKLPKLNDIIGAKSINGSFYRAKVVKKINDVSYDVQFIDYGIEENVSLSDIVSLSMELKKVVHLFKSNKISKKKLLQISQKWWHSKIN